MMKESEAKRILIALGAIIVLLLCIYVLSRVLSASRTPVTSPSSIQTSPQGPERPLLTDAVKAQLQASHGFQVLVSYTNTGFKPLTVHIKKGETVRFTNNSSGQLWVIATGTALYPETSASSCGQSAFDSCQSISPEGFFEFTFTASGTWNYANKLNEGKTGSIQVK